MTTRTNNSTPPTKAPIKIFIESESPSLELASASVEYVERKKTTHTMNKNIDIKFSAHDAFLE